MSVLVAARSVGSLRATLKKVTYPLAINQTAFQGGIACIDTSAIGALKPGAGASATLIRIGLFINSVTTTGAQLPVEVDLDEELTIDWFDPAGAGTPTIANLFQQLYLASDHEVTTTVGTNSKAGIMWALGGVFGVGMNYPGAIGVGKPLGLF